MPSRDVMSSFDLICLGAIYDLGPLKRGNTKTEYSFGGELASMYCMNTHCSAPSTNGSRARKVWSPLTQRFKSVP